MVLDHLFVIQILLIRSVNNVSNKCAWVSASHFTHRVQGCASLGFPFVVIHLVVHTWSHSPTLHGLDWTLASEVSAPKYFMDTVWMSAHVGVP